ncbi:MAG TPA: ABC transporter ATP-binding protein [Casimicrobiaceae bacterium]|jgi:ABC-type nitrate/sulfonate/bicarbonate transport system ATPase subunit|nr:ABC transporter ATP-binding protein [Casimicrobiaceae bacterium]
MTIEPVALDAASRRETAKLVVDGVSKRFGTSADAVQALEPIDLAVGAGEFLTIVGPSGCGKSTLLNIVAGFETPTTGRAVLDGKAIAGPGPERGVVFQQGALFTWMSVLDNVAFGPRALGKGVAEAREIAGKYIELVGLTGFAKRYSYELSGGMQQRVGIARALANEPEVLLMDEPFAALDQQTRELLQEEIRAIWRRTAKTILWITHSIEEALFLATHVVVMTARPGRIKAAFACGFSREADPLVATTPAFAEAKRTVVALLRQESLEAQRQETAA